MKIPKIIHQIWIGTKEIPNDFILYRQTWLKKHPNWNYVLWDNLNISKLKYLNFNEYEKLANWSEKSDYLRVIILLEYGGVYVDTDFECLQPLDNLIKSTSFFIGRDSGGKMINTAIIGSTKKHRIIKKIYLGFSKQIKIFHQKHDFNKIGPFYVDKIINTIPLNEDEKVFNEKIFYPIEGSDYFKGINIDKLQLIKSGSFGIHHYTYSWSRILYLKRKYLYRYSVLRFLLIKITLLKEKIGKYLK